VGRRKKSFLKRLLKKPKKVEVVERY